MSQWEGAGKNLLLVVGLGQVRWVMFKEAEFGSGLDAATKQVYLYN